VGVIETNARPASVSVSVPVPVPMAVAPPFAASFRGLVDPELQPVFPLSLTRFPDASRHSGHVNSRGVILDVAPVSLVTGYNPPIA
jgi:hypothetical protein